MQIFPELLEWYTARKICIEHTIHNIKDDPEYRWRLERLSKAEQSLVKIVRENTSD